MLTSTTNKVQYTIAYPFGATYAIPYKYWMEAELVAVLSFPVGTADQALTLDVDYSLSAPGDTGTLTKLTDWDHAAVRLTIYRVLANDQQTDYRNGEAVDMDLLEQDFDRAAARDQQLSEIVDRAVSVPITDPTASLELPSAASRALGYLAFDADGNAIPAVEPGSYPASPFAATILDDTTAVAARATLGAVAQADFDLDINLLKATTHVAASNWSDILKFTLPPFVPTPIHKGFVALLGTARNVSRTTTSTSAGKLVDSGALFVTDGVLAGDYIYNSTDGTWARVTARDSQTQLSVDNDVFPTGKNYRVWPVPTWPDNIKECDGSTISDAESPINGVRLPDLNSAGAYADNTVAGGLFIRGGTTPGVVQEDQFQKHKHSPNTAGTSYALKISSGGSYVFPGAGTTMSDQPRTGSADQPDGSTPRTGTETRGRAISMIYIMRIK